MKGKVAVAFLGLVVQAGLAQTVADVHSVLQASLAAMGGANLKTIQYSATGWSSRVGQTYGLAEDWPRYEVTDYTRVIDYGAKWSREDYTRRQGKYPLLGRPPMPEEHVTSILRGTYAWDMRGDKPVPLTSLYLDGVPYTDLRQLELAITPHGFLKAALAAKDATAITLPIIGPSDYGLSQNGRKVTIVSFTIGKYRVNGTINDQNLVELTDTWFPNPVYGDMDYEMRYTNYMKFDGVEFPTLLHVHQGDPRLNPAHNYYEYNVTDVKANVPVTPMAVPDEVRAATAPPVRVESEKLAEGVWLLGGGTHNSVLVEFKDFLTVIEAPQNEARSLAVIAEATRLVPSKLIRYVVNTHHHFDHAGGLRAFVAEGSTIVTHQVNKAYYEKIFKDPHTLVPDKLSQMNPQPKVKIETMTEKKVMTDGEHTIEIYHVQGSTHNEGMLIAYLPKQKVLVEADEFNVGAANAPTPANINPYHSNLLANIERLHLDVDRIIPVHLPNDGRKVAMAELYTAAGKKN